MIRVLEELLDLIWPRTCAFCQCVIRDSSGICKDCRASLPFIPPERKLSAPEFSKGCISPLKYEERAVQAMHRFKFRGSWHYGRIFAGLMAACLGARPEEVFDRVTYVPGSHERRYEPAKLLAAELCKTLAWPRPRKLLRKIRRTARQSTLTSSERKANVLGAYALCPGAEVRDKRILLVDDVCTTGATLGECARILMTGGAASVTCITLARGTVRRDGTKKRQKPEKHGTNEEKNDR